MAKARKAAANAAPDKVSSDTGARKAATEAQFAAADAKGAPTDDERDAIVVRQGVTGL